MKFFTSTLPIAMLAASSMMPAALAEGTDIHQYIETSLDNVDGPMNEDELSFLNSMWEAAYNIVHEGEPGEQVTMTHVSLKNLGSSRRGLRGSDRKLQGGGSTGGGWGDGHCSLCGRRDLQEGESLPGDSETLHRRFERKLTTLLREGPYEYFLDLEDVHVSFTAGSSGRRALQGTGIHQYVETFIANVEGPMNEDELNFLNSMWEAAYNIVHEGESGEQVTITNIALENQGSGGDRKLQGGGSTGGGWGDGHCSLCGRRALQEGEESLPGDSETLHRRFERKLTDLLREGPYRYFQDAEDVTVSFVSEA